MRDRESGRCQGRTQPREIVHDEGRMSLFGRDKILLNPKVNFETAVLEPAAAAPGKIGRLCELRNSKDSLIEIPGLALPPRGHREQDMIQPPNAHRFTPVPGN